MRSDVENIEREKNSYTYDEVSRECSCKKNMENNEVKLEDSEKYASKKPYPKIKVKEKNKYYADILSNDFAGACSEMSAVTQYVNHHIRSGIINERVSKVLLEISKVEMRHLDILGQLILLLGGEPYYGKSKKEKFQCWTPKFINYGKDVRSMLKLDIQHEVDAVVQYKKHIEEIEDEHIQKILERIIEDEEVHIEILDSLLKTCNK